MRNEKVKLVVIGGWPFSGKTTLAEGLVKLGRDNGAPVHHIDIDAVRALMVGIPYPHPNESPELMKRDGQEMGMAYRLLLAGAHENLAAGRSLIITATFSRKVGQQILLDLMTKHTNAELKFIQCVPQGDTEDEVARRMASRSFGEGAYVGGVNSPERYFEVKTRYDPIDLPHIKIGTWGSKNDGGSTWKYPKRSATSTTAERKNNKKRTTRKKKPRFAGMRGTAFIIPI